MNRNMTVVALLAAVSAISSCNSSNNAAAPEPQQPGVKKQVPAWSFTYKSTCAEGVDATQCVGLYGFSVSADGTFSAGPDSTGYTLSGKITSDEFTALSSAVTSASALVAVDTNGADTCVEADAITTTDTISAIHLTKTAVIAHQTGSQFCYKGNNAEASKALYAEIITLADAYYTLPFPDACKESAAKLTAMYATLQNCSAASECSYVSAIDFHAIAPDAQEWVATDNCSIISPMVVGNTLAVTNAAAGLNQALLDAQNTCGQSQYSYRSNCTQTTGFNSSSVAPVCGADHLCHVGPAASAL